MTADRCLVLFDIDGTLLSAGDVFRLGVRAVAVASGKTPRPTLAAKSPDALFDDLADTAAVLAAILA